MREGWVGKKDLKFNGHKWEGRERVTGAETEVLTFTLKDYLQTAKSFRAEILMMD